MVKGKSKSSDVIDGPLAADGLHWKSTSLKVLPHYRNTTAAVMLAGGAASHHVVGTLGFRPDLGIHERGCQAPFLPKLSVIL